MSECDVRRRVRADVPGRRGVRGGSVPAQMAGRLRLPGLRKQERGPAQAAALRPPVPRLQEADVGGGRDVHASLARAAEELASGHPHHDFAFERDVGLAAPEPSGPGELQVGLDAGAEDPPGDGGRRRVSADHERAGGRDEHSLPPQGLRAAAGRAQPRGPADDRRGGRGVRGERSRVRQAPQDHGPVRPDAEGVPRRRRRTGNLDRGRRLGRLRRAGEPYRDRGRRQAGA